jgi:hypothetical protein
MQNIGVVFCDLFGAKTNPFKKGKNCSEVVCEILKSEGYKFTKDADLVTPEDIEKVLLSK